VSQNLFLDDILANNLGTMKPEKNGKKFKKTTSGAYGNPHLGLMSRDGEYCVSKLCENGPEIVEKIHCYT
jgi:hypothetical protein